MSLFLDKYSTTLNCDANRDNPKSESLYRCDKSIDNFNRFDSGDTYETFQKLIIGLLFIYCIQIQTEVCLYHN